MSGGDVLWSIVHDREMVTDRDCELRGVRAREIGTGGEA
jgi:hypothetical protein